MESKIKLPSKNFWANKKVIITGHTGFTGSWLSLVLINFGASVYGVSLKPNTHPSLFEILKLKKKIKKNFFCDINNLKKIKFLFKKINPDIIIHLAAQPIVNQAMKDPVETFKTNIIGTINICEASRNLTKLRQLLLITTDKCYKNSKSNKIKFFDENDELGGDEPYAASKASAEIVINSYVKTYFKKNKIQITTARAGNIIGGGDWAKDRIIPDIFKSLKNGKKLVIRNPNATRPWQHVLDVINGYILLIESKKTGSWNFGPKLKSSRRVIDILNFFKKKNNKLKWLLKRTKYKNESINLNLSSKKSLKLLKWSPKWDFKKSLTNTQEWYECFYTKKDIINFTNNQIKNYFKV